MIGTHFREREAGHVDKQDPAGECFRYALDQIPRSAAQQKETRPGATDRPRSGAAPRTGPASAAPRRRPPGPDCRAARPRESGLAPPARRRPQDREPWMVLPMSLRPAVPRWSCQPAVRQAGRRPALRRGPPRPHPSNAYDPVVVAYSFFSIEYTTMNDNTNGCSHRSSSTTPSAWRQRPIERWPHPGKPDRGQCRGSRADAAVSGTGFPMVRPRACGPDTTGKTRATPSVAATALPPRAAVSGSSAGHAPAIPWPSDTRTEPARRRLRVGCRSSLPLGP